MAMINKILDIVGAPQKHKPQGEKIGKEQIAQATQILQKYKQGKANLENRIIENEQWYKMRHWEQIRPSNDKPTDPEPASAWLFNSIANKHADAMDNFPEPNVLPREQGDKEAAKQLSQILPVILEHNEFEQTYSDTWWYKLKTGTGVYGVFWNPMLENGLGDIDIKQIDILNIFWEPGIKDIQKSKNLFTVELVDNDILTQSYSKLKGKLKSATVDVAKYIYDDTVDTSQKSAVVDWYYKVFTECGEVLHYCKFVNNEVLYASENDAVYAKRGFYDHGMYPFVFDTMFVEEGTPCGFGYIDVMKDTQMYIDKLNQSIIKNALMATKKRFFIKNTGSVNEEEFADWSKDFVHVSGSSLGDDSIREIQVQPLNPLYVQILQQKIDELKETSGNRDFSQGGTSGGVTAASAIAALQEAGSKLSRDMIKNSYRAFRKVNYLCLELIRQFYDEPRCFRISGAGEQRYVTFSNAAIKPQPQGSAYGVDLGERRPVFDIQIISQKSSPFNKIAQNELAKEMYAAGFFDPSLSDQALIAVEMMDFEGKQSIIQKISQNKTLLQRVNDMQMQMQHMAQIIDATQGTRIAPATAPETEVPAKIKANVPGTAFKNAGGTTTAAKARERALNIAKPE
ncbi:MAG: hypothetical protein PHX02_01595 [Oscillospiraceae bacterium]|jgi:hypothetical protein|nr:hypothetical protein [Oscillospiraceae bacterium]